MKARQQTHKEEREEGVQSRGGWNPASRELKDLLAMTRPDACITVFKLQKPSMSHITWDAHPPSPTPPQEVRVFVLML